MDTKPTRPVNKSAGHDIQPRRPVAPPQLVSAQPVTAASSKSKQLFIIAIVLLVLALAVAGWTWYQYHKGNSLINTSRYQSVTLDTGKVYFGKLSNVNDQYMKLTDVYYLQDKNGTSGDKSTDTTATSTDNPTLIKHGTELQNPEDEIVLSKGDIVSWENLKDSGKVVDAIKNYKAQQGQ